MADTDCFERLASLVDQLPAMEKASARLRRAEAAQAALVAQRELAEAEGLLAAADRQIAEVEQAQARAARTLLFWGQQRGLHVGPANNARAHLAQALRAGGFSDASEAEAALIPENEHDELAERIAHYQRDYAEALAACEEVEGDSGTATDAGLEL